MDKDTTLYGLVGIVTEHTPEGNKEFVAHGYIRRDGSTQEMTGEISYGHHRQRITSGKLSQQSMKFNFQGIFNGQIFEYEFDRRILSELDYVGTFNAEETQMKTLPGHDPKEGIRLAKVSGDISLRLNKYKPRKTKTATVEQRNEVLARES